MKLSEVRIRRYKLLTIALTSGFISLMFIGISFTREMSIEQLLIEWGISMVGAILIIQYSYHQIEKLRKSLYRQFSKATKNSQYQNTLARLSRIFAATQNEDEVCLELARRLQEIPGFDYVAVYLLDDTGNRILRSSFGHPDAPKWQVLKPGAGLCELAMLEKQLRYTPNIQEEPRYLSGLGQGSECDIPIQYDAVVMGVIVVENYETDSFTQDDFELLTTAADQAAIALQNAKLISAEIKRRQEAEVLRTATMAVSSELDQTHVLDHILTQLEKVVPFESAAVFLWEGKSLVAKAARGLPNMEAVIGRHFPAEDELFQLILKNRHPIIIEDVQADVRFEAWGDTFKIRGWMGLPLHVGNEILGLLTIDHLEPNAYNEETASLAKIFANQAAVALQNAQLYTSAKNSAEKLMILYEASKKITAASFDPELTYQAIHQAASQLMPSEAFSITILDEKENDIEAVYLIDRDGRAPSARIPIDQGLSGYIIATGKPILVHNFLESEKMGEISAVHFGSPEHIMAFIAVPMVLGDKVIGMLSSQSYQPYEYSDIDQQMLEMLAAHAAIAIDNARLFSEIQSMATTDSLTQVFNRRYFFDMAKQEFVRNQRYEHPLSIIMLDLDHYKLINDRYGHVVGDIALQKVAAQIKANIRESDTLGRYGGDEFAILLPETPRERAMEIAERLREDINSTVFDVNENPFKTSISIGVSSLNEHVSDLSQLLLCADMASYDAKNGGRNKVFFREWPIDSIPPTIFFTGEINDD